MLPQAGGGRAPCSLGSALSGSGGTVTQLSWCFLSGITNLTQRHGNKKRDLWGTQKTTVRVKKTHSIREPRDYSMLGNEIYTAEDFTQTASLLIVAAGMV